MEDNDAQTTEQHANATAPVAVPVQPGGLTPLPAGQHVPKAAPPMDAKVGEKRGSWVTSKWFMWFLLLFVIPGPSLYVLDKIDGGLKDQALSYSGYRYTFSFYSHSSPIELKGIPAVDYKHTALAFAEVTQDPLPDSCSDLGNGWSQAFTATVAGAERPVCTSTSNKARLYFMDFSAFDTTHLFTISFNTDQKDAAKLSADTVKLQKIFDSVKVAQD